MNEYIPEEYSRVIEDIRPIIEEYDLDEVTISSLVRGCIEVENQQVEPASKLWKAKDGNVYSVKPSNIKVNLSFALGNAFRLKTIFSQKDVWLVLAIIHLIVDLFTSAVTKVDEISAITLLAVFRLQKEEKDKIVEYTKKIVPSKSRIVLDNETIEQALDNLEELKCIKLAEGKYCVCETVDNSLFSYEEK